jgi:hypothetical protein
MDICIGDYGIALEMIGFVLLLAGVRTWFDKKYLGKQLDYKPILSWHWWRNNCKDVGIVLVISGLVMQFSFLNGCFP